MKSPKVSIIIPAYNGADHLRKAIQSVLHQTYTSFELIVVNDASPDHTHQVVNQFDDVRLRYIVFEKNRGSDAARRAGLEASSGDIIAFLDQDDLFHPDKLQEHVSLYAGDPELGATYNSRFDFNHSDTTIRAIWRAPESITLADLVLGFPFAPSEMMLRRKWAFQEDIWDDSFVAQGDEVIVNGGEIVFCGRLYMAGCKFAHARRALNYRRYHAGRVYSDIVQRCKSEIDCQNIILDDPRCPAEVVALRHIAYMNTYLSWSYFAFAQDEPVLGREWLAEAVHLNPSITSRNRHKLLDFLVTRSVADESRGHASLLQLIFTHLPDEIPEDSVNLNWAIARGYLFRGARAVVWNRPDIGREHFEQAAALSAEIDEQFIQQLTHQLINYEIEFGSEATQEVIHKLVPHLRQIGGDNSVRKLMGCYSVNRAFQRYRDGRSMKVPRDVMSAVMNQPGYLTDRGVLSMLFRSLLRIPTA